MKAPSNNSCNHLGNDKGKYNKFRSELKAVLTYLTNNNATATMAAVALNIYRPNLSRYKSTLQKQGCLIELQKSKCKETGCTATYLSCNPELVKKGSCNGL